MERNVLVYMSNDSKFTHDPAVKYSTAYNREWRKANPSKARQYNLRYFYNLSLEDYDELVEKCGGVCGICGTDSPGRKNETNWPIDHDHTCCPSTKKGCGNCIRGILCHSCNQKMGWYEKHMNKIAEYIVERTL